MQQPTWFSNPLLVFIFSSLLIVGYVMVSSSSLHLGDKVASNIFYYPVKQFVHIVMGGVAAFFVMQIPLRTWQELAPILLILGLGLLLFVLLPGVGIKVKGSIRWLSIAGLRIQVSEIFKFISVVYMADYVTRHLNDIQQSAYGLINPLMPFSVAFLLFLLEPDFGSVVVVLVIVMGIMFLAGARLSQFLILITLAGVAAAALIYFSAYRWARIKAFIDPWADAQDTGFQLVQALIAFGRGEIFGVGLGSGIQKLFYLPEAHTDFLLSVLAEELGLIGVVAVIALFSLLVWRCFVLAEQAKNKDRLFAAFTAYGLGIWFGFQSFINMGVNMGVLPTKGLTLPLMSYGGGSMIVMCAAFGLLFRVNHEVAMEKGRKPDA